MERKMKVGVWATALSGVPVEELLPLAKSELSERESAFFPVPADLLRRWHARHRRTPEGAANASAYLPYVPSPQPALLATPPPLQIEPEELKRRLRSSNPRPSAATTQFADESRSEPSEGHGAVLLDVARAGNIALERCTPAQLADLSAFGRWWLAYHPRHELAPHNFAATYAQFVADA